MEKEYTIGLFQTIEYYPIFFLKNCFYIFHFSLHFRLFMLISRKTLLWLRLWVTADRKCNGDCESDLKVNEDKDVDGWPKIFRFLNSSLHILLENY